MEDSMTAEAPVTNPATEEPNFPNYWGVSTTEKFYFPDKRMWIEFKRMNEGDKKKYQQKTNRDVTIQRGGDTKIGIDPATDRHLLIEMSVINWQMWMPKDLQNPGLGFEQVGFSTFNLRKFLEVGDPKVIQDLETEIRMANPWMQADMTVEEIDKEIARLNEVRAQREEADRAKASSGLK